MNKILKFCFFILISINILNLSGQNKTDVSLFLRADSTKQLFELSSETGDLYQLCGHHGPAIENEWLGLRLYFDKKCVIDVYSKAKPGLELKEAKWYPSISQQKNGWGADYYKVGSTLGLGGVRLWDGENVVPLNPVTKRTARVSKEAGFSMMEMLSEGVPYKNTKVDILVRVTVFSGQRNAMVEAFALSDIPVQFVTGVNYHKEHKVYREDGLIVSWGIHPEDVAAEIIEIGAAIIYNPEDFVKTKDDGSQILLITDPVKTLKTWISSANAREKDINSQEKFVQFLKEQ